MKKSLKSMAQQVLQQPALHSEALPALDLYMDQVVTLLQDAQPWPEQKPLTKAMVNNYSKAGLLSPVKGKKYRREQVVQLLAVTALKGTLSMDEIKQALDVLYADPDFDGAALAGCYEHGLMQREKLMPALAALLGEDDALPCDTPAQQFSALLAVCAMAQGLTALAGEMSRSFFDKAKE